MFSQVEKNDLYYLEKRKFYDIFIFILIKNREGIFEPHQLLVKLLKRQIENEKEKSSLAQELLVIIDPKNSPFFSLANATQYVRSFFNAPQKIDPIIVLIKHLHLNRKNLPYDLQIMLSAFFYIYRQYNVFLSNDLVKLLQPVSDIWEKKRKRMIRSMFEFSQGISWAKMEMIEKAIDYVPEHYLVEVANRLCAWLIKQREALVVEPIWYFRDTINLLIKLKDYISQADGLVIITCLEKKLKDENSLIAAVAFEGLNGLKTFLTPDQRNKILYENTFTQVVTPLIDRLKRPDDEIKHVVDAVNRLKIIFPTTLSSEISDALQPFPPEKMMTGLKAFETNLSNECVLSAKELLRDKNNLEAKVMKLLQDMTQASQKYAIIKPCLILQHVKYMLPQKICEQVINTFITMISKPSMAYEVSDTLAIYIDKMNYNQKIKLLCHAEQSYFNDVLFLQIYSSYRSENAISILKRFPSEQKNYLPNDVANVMHSFLKRV